MPNEGRALNARSSATCPSHALVVLNNICIEQERPRARPIQTVQPAGPRLIHAPWALQFPPTTNNPPTRGKQRVRPAALRLGALLRRQQALSGRAVPLSLGVLHPGGMAQEAVWVGGCMGGVGACMAGVVEVSRGGCAADRARPAGVNTLPAVEAGQGRRGDSASEQLLPQPSVTQHRL